MTNISSTGENYDGQHGEHDEEQMDKQIRIYEEINQKAIELQKQLGINKEDALKKILVLSRKNDPYYIGSNSDIKKALWVFDIWKKYQTITGKKDFHPRGLHYFVYQVLSTKEKIVPPVLDDRQLRTWTEYDNLDCCDDFLRDCIIKARLLGLIPGRYIRDERNDTTPRITILEHHRTEFTRPEYTWKPVVFPGKYDLILPSVEVKCSNVNRLLENISINCAKDLVDGGLTTPGLFFNEKIVKPFHIEIWSEKTVPDYIKKAGEKADIIVEGTGSLGYTVAEDFLNRIEEKQQPGIVLYLSDFDVNGNNMPIEMIRKIQLYREKEQLTQDVYLEHLAVTKEQVKRGLPGKPITLKKQVKKGKKGYETKKEKHKNKKLDKIVELQVFEGMPNEYEELVRNAVDEWTFPDTEISTVKKNTKDILKERIKTDLLNELNDKKNQLEKWLNSTVELSKEVKELLPDPEDIKQKYRKAEKKVKDPRNKSKEINDCINDIFNNLDLPEVVPPTIRIDPPWDNCLYDSRRPYLEQVRILQNYKDTGDKITGGAE